VLLELPFQPLRVPLEFFIVFEELSTLENGRAELDAFPADVGGHAFGWSRALDQLSDNRWFFPAKGAADRVLLDVGRTLLVSTTRHIQVS
jgi:hypothetical protein